MQTPANRRQFFRQSAGIVAAGTVPAGASPNEKVGIAIAGLRTRGRSLAQAFVELDDVAIVALCDVPAAFTYFLRQTEIGNQTRRRQVDDAFFSP